MITDCYRKFSSQRTWWVPYSVNFTLHPLSSRRSVFNQMKPAYIRQKGERDTASDGSGRLLHLRMGDERDRACFGGLVQHQRIGLLGRSAEIVCIKGGWD